MRRGKGKVAGLGFGMSRIGKAQQVLPRRKVRWEVVYDKLKLAIIACGVLVLCLSQWLSFLLTSNPPK